jgi:hypothetical protein
MVNSHLYLLRLLVMMASSLACPQIHANVTLPTHHSKHFIECALLLAHRVFSPTKLTGTAMAATFSKAAREAMCA